MAIATNPETKARVIKKYQNRKLYDTSDSCYITLDEIAKLIQKGEDVVVLDNRTKRDVTSVILTQILVDQEKSQKSILPLSMLKEIIRSGTGSLFDFIQRYVVLGVQSENDVQGEVNNYVERMVNRGEISRAEAKTLVTELVTDSETQRSELRTQVAKTVEDSVRQSANLTQIEDRISRLHERLDRLEVQVRP